MIKDYDKFIAHLKATGRMGLLPDILRELKRGEIRQAKLAPRKESAAEYPHLISGTRTIENGVLIDHTGKRALLDIYQKIVGSN